MVAVMEVVMVVAITAAGIMVVAITAVGIMVVDIMEDITEDITEDTMAVIMDSTDTVGGVVDGAAATPIHIITAMILLM
jgi:hypothetical protein